MRKIRQYLSRTFIVLCFGLFVLSFIGLCYAQTNPENIAVTPEVSSLALISTGIIGWGVRFARKRFHQFKKGFDTFASLLGIVMSAPIIALTAIIIKIASPGPVFFKQKRIGIDGKPFDIYKLRTMKVDAEKNTGPVWADEDDARLISFRGIKLGKMLRKMHLDELPQFINVLRGEMSIIGPRPERPVFVNALSKEINDYSKRLKIKPGITGLAQVWHKYDETIQDVKKKVKYDLLYIKKMCFLVDLRILLRTVVVAATGKGAR